MKLLKNKIQLTNFLPEPPQTIKVNDPYEEDMAIEEDVSSEPMQNEDVADNCDSSESNPQHESEEFLRKALKSRKKTNTKTFYSLFS